MVSHSVSKVELIEHVHIHPLSDLYLTLINPTNIGYLFRVEGEGAPPPFPDGVSNIVVIFLLAYSEPNCKFAQPFILPPPPPFKNH